MVSETVHRNSSGQKLQLVRHNQPDQSDPGEPKPSPATECNDILYLEIFIWG